MKDNKLKTCLEDLPNELLSRILACLSLKHDLDNVQLVCRRWYAVVDETIGREIAITSLTTSEKSLTIINFHFPDFPCVPYAHLGYLGFDMISKMGIKTCYVDLTNCDISDFQVDVQYGSNSEKRLEMETSSNPIPTFKYPHLLKQLYFSGAIKSELFQRLLTNIEKLTLLQINMLALSQLIPSDLKNLKLPQLKALGVAKCLKATGRNFDDSLGLPNLVVLLEENVFPNLRQLDLRFPIKNFKDFRTIRAVLKCLSVNKILRELYVVMEFPVQVNVLRGFQEELEDLKNFAQSHRNRDSLRICDIQGIRIHASYPQLQIWVAFLEQQRCLRSLTLRLGHLSAPFLDLLCSMNRNSLEHLFLYKLNEIIDNDPGSVVTILDCGVFSRASQLQTIYALGCDMVTNVKSLPGSLTTLFLSGVITSEEVEFILFEIPELQFVNLKNASLGKQQGFGVSMNLLRRFVEARKVKRLILNGASLSEDYPSEGLSNGDTKNPTNLMEFDSWETEHMYLDWELNNDNYYIDKCY